MQLSARCLATGLGGLLFAAGAVQAGAQPQSQYSLDTTYDRKNFFQAFDFFTEPDPTHGFVEYVDQATAQQDGLIGYGRGNSSRGYGKANNGTIVLGVDYKTVNPANGRRSVRVTSQQSFTHGLFLADIAHMPNAACGVWPAFWMFGPNWPTSGEIDIIEGVNLQDKGTVTLHTSPGCTMSNEGTLSSTYLKDGDCGASGTSAGCGQQTADTQNYGDGFNAIRGGVYATEWTSEHIAVWFFPRSAIPRDVASGQPNPETWGQPMARFAGGSGCDIDSHFSNNQLVFDTTFCGDWAGNPDVWGSDKTCAAKAATCNDYVAANPGEFRDAFWEINSVKVFQQGQSGGQKPQPTQWPPKTTGQPLQTQRPQPTYQPPQPHHTQQPQSGSGDQGYGYQPAQPFQPQRWRA
ncbi:glycosyl hydrolases family 16 domain-containing protein [Hirsutella rhossiliensis]|uniref:endo-1,3(4)-beta-glucanase n=1 Tax=Hirsutella rhossiliensis TaxID=111463 RepID=A0A9P8SIF1_9HYPO|nr:glycosyl hydrolases family 16 domain-containing protein [Hirsutella rhossiliensis]KAH0963109.1 glycosyl hydrolases family 16 domain-containing protein [Hirsutella rhossiliensis]